MSVLMPTSPITSPLSLRHGAFVECSVRWPCGKCIVAFQHALVFAIHRIRIDRIVVKFAATAADDFVIFLAEQAQLRRIGKNHAARFVLDEDRVRRAVADHAQQGVAFS
jgi:hypothetical protein